MTKHYTSVDIIGSRIFHRYFDGKHQQEVLDKVPMELYVKNGKTDDSASIYGDKLSCVKFDTISEASEFLKVHGEIMKVYGQTSFVHQFISDCYPDELKFSIDNFVIAGLDIETLYGTDGFPTPDKAAYPISAITVKIFGEPGFITWGVKTFKKIGEHDVYYHLEDEKTMLASFINWWNRTRPDIITGWNIVGFDIPYLVNRLTSILGEAQAQKLSPFHANTSKVFTEFSIMGSQTSYRILGVTIFDYLELYKKFNYTKHESYTLENIANYELGEAKIDYSEDYTDLMDLYERNPQLYYEYNVHDVKLIERLDDKMKYVFLAITVAFIGKVRMYEIFSQVKFWDNVVYNDLKAKNIQIPPHIDHGHVESIAGAFVRPLIPGLYEWLVSLDLTSLYPSIIMTLNLSPETLVSEASGTNILDSMINMTYDTSDVKAKNLTIAANGSTYRRDVQGVLPEITEKMFANRKMYKGMMIGVQKELELIKAEMAKRGLHADH